MAKVYQAFYKDVEEKTTRHHSASLTLVEKEARLTAEETGKTVCVDVLEIEKPSLKSIIKMLNGEEPLSRTRLFLFHPIQSYLQEDEEGTYHKRWKIRKVSS